MFAISQKISSLVKTIVYNTKKSKRTTTPKPFNNAQLTPRGIERKPSRSYNYNLPENLPNRHLYFDRVAHNKLQRKRYNKERLRKLGINPIHDQNGNKLKNRDAHQISFELSSLQIIKGSVSRTLENIWEALQRFPQRFLEKGQDADVLLFAFQQVHDRHLPTLNFYKFSNYCQLRYLAKLPPTQTLMLHFFKFLECAKQNNGRRLIKFERLGQLSSYIFSRQYPQCNHLLSNKPITFELFKQGEQKFITFDDIVPNLYDAEYLKQIKSKMDQKNIKRSLKSILRLPSGDKLIKAINNA